MRPPLASFASAKPETDGRKIKPAQLFFSRLPLAYATFLFYPCKTGSGRPKNKTCTVIFLPSYHWSTPLASFASAKQEADGQKIKPARPILSHFHWRPSLASFAPAKSETDSRKNKTCMVYFLSSSIGVPHSPVLPPQNRKRMADKNKTCTAHFLPPRRWNAPLASFAPAKSEADGREK